MYPLMAIIDGTLPHRYCRAALLIFLSYCVPWPKVYREIAGGMYSPIAYWVASNVITILFSFLVAFVQLPFTYAILDLPIRLLRPTIDAFPIGSVWFRVFPCVWVVEAL